MSLYVRSDEAARRLGVSRATLYAYVSRGLIDRRTAIDGRTSLYAADDLDALAARSRRRPAVARPSIDVQISTEVARLDEEGLTYRGHDVAQLATTETFPRVAELLWTGRLPSRNTGTQRRTPGDTDNGQRADGGDRGQWRRSELSDDEPRWPEPSDDELAACRGAVEALGTEAPPIHELLAIAGVLAARHRGDDVVTAAKRVLAAVVSLDGRRRRGGYAERLLRRWHRRPSPQLAVAVDRALVLLADHELATSTLAARVAASVRPEAYAPLIAGLATMTGRLHGSSAAEVRTLLDTAAGVGAERAITQQLEAGRIGHGFGHKVYRDGDPRLGVLLEAVRELPDPAGRSALVDDVLHQAAARAVAQPNLDFGLAALTFVGRLPADVPIFAVARIAGWAAHVAEEFAEAPLRFRGLATGM